jgi:hypothetical protein
MIPIVAGLAGLLLLALSIVAAGRVLANLPRIVLVTPTGDLAVAIGRLLPVAVRSSSRPC